MTDRVLVLEAGRADRRYWRELWEYRELFFILGWRDVAVRYKQTAVGMAWAVIQPLLTTAILVVVFGKLAKMHSDGAPYPLMVFAGLLPWYLFSSSVTAAAESIIASSNLIKKVYIPRLIIPAATVLGSLVDLLINVGLLLVIMLWYRFVPGWQILLLPIFIALALAASLGPGLWISALNARYRDFRYVIPFLLQFGLYISPVGFSSSAVPAHWRLLYSLNPMTGVIDGFRWCILGSAGPTPGTGFLLSVAMIALILWLGVRAFRRTEKTFADLV